MIKFIFKNIYLLVIMSLITFFSISTLYNIQERSQINNNLNNFLSDEAVYFNVKGEGSIAKDKVFKDVKEKYIFIESKNKTSRVFYIDTNKNIANIPPIITGRFFSKKDFINSKCIVIGKAYVNDTVKIDGEKYYFIDGEYYKVIGVMGKRKRQTSYDLNIYVNNSVIQDNKKSISEGNYIIDAGKNSKAIYKKISNKITAEGMKTKIINKNNSFDKLDLKSDNLYKISFLIKILAVFIVDIFIVTNYWMRNIYKEIGIRRALGGSKLNIINLIISKLLLVSIASYFIGNFTYVITNYLSNGFLQFYFKESVIVFLFNIVVCILSSIVPIVKSLRIEPQEIMR